MPSSTATTPAAAVRAPVMTMVGTSEGEASPASVVWGVWDRPVWAVRSWRWWTLVGFVICWRWGAVMTFMACGGWAIVTRRPAMRWMALVAAFTSLRVEGSKEWVVGAGGLEVGDEVPERS